MKYLLIILFTLIGLQSFSQVYQEDTTKYMKNPAAYPSQLRGFWATSILRIPDTTNNRPQQGVPGAMGRNTEGTKVFMWDGSAWVAGGGVTVDTVLITSIDSIFITNTDSIFIVSGNDTIFIGNGNPAVDTIYQRGDSIFAVKSGAEFLAGLTGSAAPSGGMDTAYQRGDSLFGVKNNEEFLVGLTGGAPTGVPGTKDTLWYNVKWFGALGDGVTDDRAAIQSANDYVSAVKGGYIWFPAGVYKVSSGIYRASFVNWEGVKDSSIVKNFNTTHTTFGDQAVMWMGNYSPSAYDTTVARFFRGHMGTFGNKMQIVDSISKFHVGDVVVIEGMTGWANGDGDWKPYVVRYNEIDSILPGTDTVVFHYQIDTILTDARINISGHFISNPTDNNGHVKYLVRNVTTRNMVFESEGQWILGMSSLGCD